MESRDLKDAMLVCHSTGGGIVARYIGRHGTKRVSIRLNGELNNLATPIKEQIAEAARRQEGFS
jgi:hypothetical protein